MTAAPTTVTDKDTDSLDIAGLLGVLNFRDDEFVSICHEPPGGPFCAAVMPPAEVPDYVARLGLGVNVWFGINSTQDPAADPDRKSTDRGTSEQVTRLVDLTADVDVKPGACRDFDVAELIIAEVSNVLGQDPTALVNSGHGLQGHWGVEGGDITAAFTVDDAKSLSRRVGRLVAAVAAQHAAKLDTVSDLARVMRVPRTMNLKSDPVPATGRLGVGGPVGPDEIDERLNEHGIYRQPDDASSDVIVSDSADWVFAEQTCSYTAAWLDGLATDGPNAGAGRNPWVCSQAVRLCCAWRLGCITLEDFKRAIAVLEGRLTTLLATTTPRRQLKRYEMKAAFTLGETRAACKTLEQARAELNDHVHYGNTAADFFGALPGAQPTTPVNGQPVAEVVNGHTTQDISAGPVTEVVRPTLVDGATFILDEPDTIPALWGRDTAVLWPSGEALMIAGGQGLGKTTAAGQLVGGLLFGGDMLGLPITTLEEDDVILYLAMDRPRQAARSMGRQFGEEHRDVLARRVKVWKGPPHADIAANPALLSVMAQSAGARVVFVDSVKDGAVGLSGDQVGAGWNRAVQLLLASGRELCELHHTVKRNPTGGAPSSAADIYGSVWLTAGCGSVILLTGEPGDPIIGFRHVKQPAEEVGPFRLFHDQAAGKLTVDHVADLIALVKASGPNGLTAKGAASALFETSKPTRAEIQKGRRKLDALVDSEHLIRVEGGTGRGNETAWFVA